MAHPSAIGGEHATRAECLLRHVFGARTIMAIAVCQVDQRALPAANDMLESAEITCENSVHDALVVARVHPVPLLVRPSQVPAGCISSVIYF